MRKVELLCLVLTLLFIYCVLLNIHTYNLQKDVAYLDGQLQAVETVTVEADGHIYKKVKANEEYLMNFQREEDVFKRNLMKLTKDDKEWDRFFHIYYNHYPRFEKGEIK